MWKSIVAGAFAASMVLPCFAQEDAGRQDLERLQGEWEIVEVVSNGRMLTPQELEGGKIVFEADRMTVINAAGGRYWSRAYQVQLHPEQSPKGLDETSLDGAFVDLKTPAIYLLEGDRLTYAVSNLPGSTARPTDFRAERGSRATRFTLVRKPR